MASHDDRRKHLCLICCAKAERPLSPELVEPVKTFLIEDYTPENVSAMWNLCNVQHVELLYKDTSEETLVVSCPEWFDFSAMRGFRSQRAVADCNCLCEQSKKSGKTPKKTSKN